MSREELTEDDFKLWVANPVTKALHAHLALLVKREYEGWGAKLYEDSDVYKAAKQNAAALGRVEAYSEILGLSFSELGETDV